MVNLLPSRLGGINILEHEYKKDDWINLNKKVKWGRSVYDCYITPDGKFDILHIEGSKSKLAKTAMFPTKPKENITTDEVVKIVSQAYIGLF